MTTNALCRRVQHRIRITPIPAPALITYEIQQQGEIVQLT